MDMMNQLPMPMDMGEAYENHKDDMDQDIREPAGDEIVLEDNIRDVLITLCSAVKSDIIRGNPIYTDEVKHKLTQETLTLFTKNPNTHNFYTIISKLLRRIARKYDDEDDDDADDKDYDYETSINIIGNLIFQIWSQYHEREELFNLSSDAIDQLALPYINLTRDIFEQL